MSIDGSSYHAIYLQNNTTKELIQKFYKIPGLFDQANNNSPNNTASGNNENGLFWGELYKKHETIPKNIKTII